jgi:hypothetical protein
VLLREVWPAGAGSIRTGTALIRGCPE